MSRAELQRFAEARIRDAKALLKARRWQGTYYLSGYAVECGLKSCILAHIETTGIIFKDKGYLQNLLKCWTHDLEELLRQAGLKDQRDADNRANANLAANWNVVTLWKETSRYEQKTQVQAQDLYDAITHKVDGVLGWIRRHW